MTAHFPKKWSGQALFALAVSAFGCAATPAAAAPGSRGTIQLAVDATDAPRRILHTHMVIPVRPGPLTLAYPLWIPGEHAPTGRTANVVGLRLTVRGKALAWTRDAARMEEIHCDVPAGTTEVEADFDYVAPKYKQGPYAGASATPRVLAMKWSDVLLYPKGGPAADLTYAARVRLPAGWKYGTSLPVAAEKDGAIEFQPTSLTALVDSPVIAGLNARTIALGPEHEIDLVGDSAEALEMVRQQVAAYHQLVAEADALFGARHYRHYRFLYTLSDEVGDFGLEHHESSDNRSGERTLLDDDLRRMDAGLLPHEFVHSWNGKYRRPASLTTADFQQPMKGDLLWVYEGLTQYLGLVLEVRTGLTDEADQREYFAYLAAGLDNNAGRKWRPLADTAIATPLLLEAPTAWRSIRRALDYYDEGAFIWLDADVTIRQRTGGQRSLDDFCRRFHGGRNAGPEVKTYTLNDVIATLNEVAPFDWKRFFEDRVDKVSQHAPLAGISGAGYRLVYTEEPNDVVELIERVDKTDNRLFSIGMTLGEGGVVSDVVAGGPAARAGVSPEMRIVAVDGRRYSAEGLTDAIVRAQHASSPIELLVENGDFFSTLRVDWHAGPRHPHLERDPSRPDLLAKIFAPRTPRPPEAVAPSPKGGAKDHD